MNRTTADAGGCSESGARERDPELEALFARARAYRPAAARLDYMLRAVRRGPGIAAGHLWRVGGVLIAVAATGIGALILLAPPGQPRAFALSRVAPAMQAAPVVRVAISTGERTVWESRGRFYASHFPDRGQYVYADYARESIATYDEARGCIIISTCDAWEIPCNIIGEFTLDGLIEEAESWGHSFEERWERTDRVENGRPIVQLKSKKPWHGAADCTITIDGDSGRILRIEYARTRTDFSYPEQAPRDLYDIGVPRDVRVVDGTAPPEVLALRDAVVARRGAGGFGAYRLARVSNVGGHGGFRVITDGRRYRMECLKFDHGREYTVEELRSIARQYDHMDSLAGQTTSIYILTENSETSVWFDENGAILGRRVCPRYAAFIPLHTLEAKTGWIRARAFFGSWPDQQYDYLGPNEKGWVGYRCRGQANNCSRPYLQERWFDPQRGYVPCSSSWQDDPQADWQLKSDWQEEYSRDPSVAIQCPPDAPARRGEGEVLEWAQLRPGQWYPAVRRSRQLERAPDGTWQLRDNPTVEGYRAVTYDVLIATPLESVDERWFEIPEEWLAVPARE